jgi:hypothetical protein
MAALTDDVKAYIVRALACFDSPTQVAKAIQADFGLTVTPQQVEAYDPNKVTGSKLSSKWRQVFEGARNRFLADTSSIGVSHRAVRLKRLERMASKAEDMGAIGLAASLLEQAAKEAGDAYTNRQKHELTGKDGGPIETAATVAIYELPNNGR